jgi:hypothetical protein
MTIITRKIFTFELSPTSQLGDRLVTVKQGDYAVIVLKNGSYIFAEILDAGYDELYECDSITISKKSQTKQTEDIIEVDTVTTIVDISDIEKISTDQKVIADYSISEIMLELMKKDKANKEFSRIELIKIFHCAKRIYEGRTIDAKEAILNIINNNDTDEE